MIRIKLSAAGHLPPEGLTKVMPNVVPLLPGDAILGMPGNDPAKWQQEFPDYAYKITELQNIKTELNESKDRLDETNRDYSEAYAVIADQRRAYYMLRRPGYVPKNGPAVEPGILINSYGAEIVTNAWIKMYELMRIVLPTPVKKFRSFHMAEAPGNFMLAINHYLFSHMPDVDWMWYANSYRQPYDSASADRTAYLEDKYGIMRKYPDRWLYGADGDGDITSPANLRSFHQHLEANGGLVDLVTSDVKYVPKDNDFSEEENINLPVHMGHLLGAMMCCKPGGNIVLKEFTQLEAGSVSLVYLGAICFGSYEIVKPESSRMANSEIYLVGLNYKPPPPDMIVKLLNIMAYVRSQNTPEGTIALFPKCNINKKFVVGLIAAQRKLAQSQMTGLDENLEMLAECQNMSIREIKDKLWSDNRKNAKKVVQAWFAANPIEELPVERRMVSRN